MDYRSPVFDELEPRTAPQPTALQCKSSSCVPEVSLIFGKRSNALQIRPQNNNKPEDQCSSYANWKKDGFPSITESGISTQVLSKRHSNHQNVRTEIDDTHVGTNLFTNPTPLGRKLNDMIVEREDCYYVSRRNSAIENTRLHGCESQSRDECSPVPCMGNETIDPSTQTSSYNGIKSILKNSLSKTTPVVNSRTDRNENVDCAFRKKNLSSLQHCSRQIDDSSYSRRSPVARCHHKNDVNREKDTVRDFLLLVQNQNEQIRSLQAQVERLLQVHEQSIAHTENHNWTMNKTNGKLPCNKHEGEALVKNSTVCGRKTCHSREITLTSSEPFDDNPEICSRYQNDPLRKTIVGKKVSIGVMTSFEFSLQNNPFVTDTDRQGNSAPRKCNKNVDETSEMRRSAGNSSRKVSNGPLENINEDSESHPSSISKSRGNDAQKTSEESTTNLIANVNESSSKRKNPNSCAPILENSRLKSLIELDNISFHRDQEERVPVLPDQWMKSSDNHGVLFPNNTLERKQCLSPITNEQIFDKSINRDSRDDSNLREMEHSGNQYNRQTEVDPMPVENTADGSFVLRSSDLRVADRSPPSPDPSIHVEMREYSSDDDNEIIKQGPAVGWTFYKNVVGQVNRILHTIPDSNDAEVNDANYSDAYQNDRDPNDDILKSVKLATLERLKMLGISYIENNECNGENIQKKVTFDSSHHLPLDHQTAMSQSTNSVIESNTSMHMKALALKYLSDEQLADLAVHRQGTTMKHKIVKSTNMSMATVNYLQRYCLTSGSNVPYHEGRGGTSRRKKMKHIVMTEEFLTKPPIRNNVQNNTVNNEGSDNILDITTLKQQPKLL